MGEEIRGYCWTCGQGLTRLDLGRESRCPGCDQPVHCCRSCRHYAPGRPNDCMEPLSERVVEKQRANFCELFEPNLKRTGGTPASPAPDPRQAAEALFRQ